MRYELHGSGQDSITTGELDRLGRATWGAGVLTKAASEAARSDGREEIPQSENPSGWVGNKNATIVQPDGETFEGPFWNRSHLVADSFGGHAIRENLIRGTRMQNAGSNDGKGGMQYCETIARQWIYAHPEGTLYYAATPLYLGEESIPRAVLVDMRSSDGTVDKEVVVYNAAKGYTIDYAKGMFID